MAPLQLVNKPIAFKIKSQKCSCATRLATVSW